MLRIKSLLSYTKQERISLELQALHKMYDLWHPTKRRSIGTKINSITEGQIAVMREL